MVVREHMAIALPVVRRARPASLPPPFKTGFDQWLGVTFLSILQRNEKEIECPCFLEVFHVEFDGTSFNGKELGEVRIETESTDQYKSDSKDDEENKEDFPIMMGA